MVYFKPDLNNEFDLNESLIDSIKRIATNNPLNNDEQSFIDCYQSMFNSTLMLPYQLTSDDSSYSDDSNLVDENDSQNAGHSSEGLLLKNKLVPGNSHRFKDQSNQMDNVHHPGQGYRLMSPFKADEEHSNKLYKSDLFKAIPGIAKPTKQ